MPAFNNAIPALGRKYDLRDVVDHVDRLLEVAQQSAAQALGQLRTLTTDPATGAALSPFYAPGYVTAGDSAYETPLSSAIASLASAQAQLNNIAKLNKVYADTLKTPIV